MFLAIYLISVSTLMIQICKAGEYDPTGRIYPWPLPTDRQPLFFGLIVSFGETFNSSGVVPGVNVALDIINSNDSDLLGGYSLHYVLSDSQCSRTTALDAFFHQILSETEVTKLAVLGAGCSPATEPTAEISHHFNITQLSCASTSPVLSDRTRFKKYFQLLPSMADIARAYVAVAQHYHWRHVTLIVQEENLFTKMIGYLKVLLGNGGIKYSEYIFSTDIGLADLAVEPFSNSSERIYVIATFENYARALLCEAFHLSIRYPTHLLLTFQWYDEKWWFRDNDSTSGINLTCNGQERESVLPYSLAFNFVRMDFNLDRNITTDLGITSNEYLKRERDHLGKAPHYFSRSLDARYCFDATFTLANALTRTLKDVLNTETNSKLASVYGLSNETSFGLEHFNYMSDALTNITFRHLENTSFNGITGDVFFNENGVRRTDYLSVYQFRNVDGDGLNWVNIGRLTVHNDLENFSFTTAEFPSGNPFDGVPEKDIATAHIAVVVIIYIFAAAGIVFSIVCLTFNCVFRNKKLIRLGSPKLNSITVFGVIILYAAMVLFAIPTKSKSVIMGLCIARLWFLSLGVSLAFGTIIMKMFRVYIIFSNPSPKRKKFIKDWMLALVVLVMVVIDLVVLLIFTAVVIGLKLNIVELVPNKEKPQTVDGETKVVKKLCIHICRSTAERVSVAILSVYKGLLQLAALILAIHTQRVRVKGLNDAKYIIAAVYASSLGLILATITHFAAIEYENLHAILFAIAVGCSSTAILGLIFIPKMVGLYKDPKGENIIVGHSSSVDAGMASIGNRGSQQKLTRIVDSQSTEDSLRRRIKELEGIISRYSGTEYGSTTDSNSMARLRVPSSSRDTNGSLEIEVPNTEPPLNNEDKVLTMSKM